MLQPLHADALAALPGVAHGFFTRAGGVSQGIYASLNCGLGSKDARDAVRENRARVAQHLRAATLITAHQAHTATAIRAHAPWGEGRWPMGDAIVTTTRGLAVGVLAADCAPVLFADGAAGVVAAAHAGWRGALGGIVEATLADMLNAGARKGDIRAAVGPCIGRDAYEVGPEFEAQFLRSDAESGRFFTHGDARARTHFDLAGYVADRLVRAGITVAQMPPACTFMQGEAFFSYRRSQRHQETDYGRQISAIVLT